MARTTRKRSHSQLDLPKTPLERDISTTESSPRFNGGAVKSGSAFEASPSTTITEPSGSPVITKKRKVSAFEEEHCHHSESDSDYETIRVLKGHPSVRDPTELPLIMRNRAGERKLLWSKLDTGADVNIMSFKVVERLGFADMIEECETSLREIGGNGVNIDRKVVLAFWAGRKNHHCQDVVFFIPSEKQDSDHDGVADVLLGLPELTKHHMITVDPDFAMAEVEEGLEVLAKRAADEVPDEEAPKGIFLGTKHPQIKVRK